MIWLGALLLWKLGETLDNGLGLTPPMGYNTWYDLNCEPTEQLIKQSVDRMKSNGFDVLGYEYINVDDCWAQGRYTNGTIYAQTPQFNLTLKPLCDYIHSMGFKCGIYTDRGSKTCNNRPGSYGYECMDTNTFAQWGFDYVKEDSCHASTEPLIAFQEYAKMRDCLSNTSRPMLFSLCGQHTYYSSIGIISSLFLYFRNNVHNALQVCLFVKLVRSLL